MGKIEGRRGFESVIVPLSLTVFLLFSASALRLIYSSCKADRPSSVLKGPALVVVRFLLLGPLIVWEFFEESQAECLLTKSRSFPSSNRSRPGPGCDYASLYVFMHHIVLHLKLVGKRVYGPHLHELVF